MLDQPNPHKYWNPDDTEWLMQPYVPEIDYSNDWEMIDLVQSLLGELDDVDRTMLELVYYQRHTFQEAASAIGLRAKSHAWRKTKLAVDNFEAVLRGHPRLMQILSDKYGIGDSNEHSDGNENV